MSAVPTPNILGMKTARGYTEPHLPTCMHTHLCVLLSPTLQLECSSSLFHPVLKSAKSWCPDIRLGRCHSLGKCHSPSSDTRHPQTWALPRDPEEGALAKLFDNQIQKRPSLFTSMPKGTIKASFPVVFPFTPVLPE